MTLNKADLVRTGTGSSAEIRFLNGVVFHVRPDSVFVIEDSFEDPASKLRRTAVKIQSGEVNFQVPSRNVPGSATMISTPTLRTTADDEAARQRERDPRRRVRGPGVRGPGPGGDRDRRAGHPERERGVERGCPGQGRTQGGPARDPVPRGPAPPGGHRLRQPARRHHPALLEGRRRALSPTTWWWERRRPISKPEVELKNWQPLSMELRGLDVGPHYWRVAAVGKDGAAGAFSETSRFTIAQGPSKAPTPLSLEPMVPKGSAGPGEGTAPSRERPSPVNGQSIDVRPGRLLQRVPEPGPRAAGGGGARGRHERRRHRAAPHRGGARLMAAAVVRGGAGGQVPAAGAASSGGGLSDRFLDKSELAPRPRGLLLACSWSGAPWPPRPGSPPCARPAGGGRWACS